MWRIIATYDLECRAEQRLQSLLIILDSRASLTSAGWQPVLYWLIIRDHSLLSATNFSEFCWPICQILRLTVANFHVSRGHRAGEIYRGPGNMWGNMGNQKWYFEARIFAYEGLGSSPFFPSPLRSSSFPLSCKYILKHLQFLKCIFWLFILPECTWGGVG